MLDGLRALVERYCDSRDLPVLFDFTALMRTIADDVEAYDAFVAQWFEGVVVPRFELREVELEGEVGAPTAVTLTLANVGTGTVSVDVAAVAGERFADVVGTGAGADATEQPGPNGVVAAAAMDTSGGLGTQDEPSPAPPWREARARVTVGPGGSVTVRVPVDFVPERVVVDPDALVLQLERKLAVHVL